MPQPLSNIHDEGTSERSYPVALRSILIQRHHTSLYNPLNALFGRLLSLKTRPGNNNG